MHRAAKRSIRASQGEPEESESDKENSSSDDNFYPSRSSSKRIKFTAPTPLNDSSDDDEEEGSVYREAGQILKIHVENFMCHKKSTTKLGRNINFITGKNGSGKSAIAVALQLCLGAKAKATGRGNNLSNLVREGSTSPAIIRVHLLNMGDGAYQPEIFGNQIVIERTIPVAGTGGGGYRLLNALLQKVSDKKEMLNSILIHFNIYIDNPCCLLTQEDSKKFISGQEAEKYDFFLKATGLHSVRQKNIDIRDELGLIKKLLPLKYCTIEKKRESLKELKHIRNLLEQLTQFDSKIRTCIAKIFWYEVQLSQAVMDNAERSMNEQMKEVEKLREERDTHSDVNSDKKKDIAQLQSVIDNLQQNQQDGIYALMEETQREVSEVGRLKGGLEADLSNIKKSLIEFQNRKEKISTELIELRNTALNNAESEEKKVMQARSLCESKIEESIKNETHLINSLQNLKEETQRKQENLRNVQGQLATIDSNISRIEQNMGSINNNSQHNGTIIGREVPKLLSLIENTRFEQPVLGPIGMLVSLKPEYQHWNRAVERTLGKFGRAFIVNTANDRRTLYGLMRRLNCHWFYSIVHQHPHPRYHVDSLWEQTSGKEVSVADVLTVNDDLVLNTLVDQCGFDRVVLARDEDYIQEHLTHNDRLRYNMSVACTITCTQVRFANGNRSSEVPDPRHIRPSYLIQDKTAQVEALNTSLLDEKRNNEEKSREKEVIDREFYMLQNQFQDKERLMNKLADSRRKLEKEKRTIDDKLLEMQAVGAFDTSELEREEQELQVAIKSLEQQIVGLTDDLRRAVEQEKEVMKKKKKVDRQKNDFLTLISDFEKQINTILTECQGHQKRQVMLSRKYEEGINELKTKEKAWEKARDININMTQQAMEKTAELIENWDGNPLELGRKETKENLEKLEKRLRAEKEASMREQNLQQYDIRQVTESYIKVKEQLEKMKEEYTRIQQRHSLLVEDDKRRSKQWVDALKREARKTRKFFDEYAQVKNAAGSVEFNHEEQLLHMVYQVDNHDKDSRSKDVRQLSGGERSFATFCLLLSLGHCIDCPFRLMDEYDVFLDEITRKLSHQMLAQYANKVNQRGRQFIIITPHKLKHITTTNQVRVIKMNDPERHSATGPQQQTLY